MMNMVKVTVALTDLQPVISSYNVIKRCVSSLKLLVINVHFVPFI